MNKIRGRPQNTKIFSKHSCTNTCLSRQIFKKTWNKLQSKQLWTTYLWRVESTFLKSYNDKWKLCWDSSCPSQTQSLWQVARRLNRQTFMRRKKEAKATDERKEKMERQTTERNKEVNTRAGEGTDPLGLVTMLFLVLFDCGCAEHKTGLKKERWGNIVLEDEKKVCILSLG